MKNYDDYLVLDTIAAAGADIDMKRGFITIDGLGTIIDVNNVLNVNQQVYAAGTASVKTYDLSGLTYSADKRYRVVLRQPQSGYEKSYAYLVDSPSAADFVDKLVADINADAGAIVTAVDATNSIQLTLDNVIVNGVAQGDFYLDVLVDEADQAVAPSVGTAYVAPNGVPAMVNAEIGENVADAAGTYSRFIVEFLDKVQCGPSAGRWDFVKKKVGIYVDENAANFAGFDLNTYFLGTKSGKTYNGAEVYVLNGVAQ